MNFAEGYSVVASTLALLISVGVAVYVWMRCMTAPTSPDIEEVTRRIETAAGRLQSGAARISKATETASAIEPTADSPQP